MATLIPSLNSCLSKMTAGEKRFASRLESHLEDDYSCWFDIPVGGRQKYSDFIVLHPGRGLLLLEVKDWKLDTIKRANKSSFEILTPKGLKSVANPLEQVRQCAYRLVDQMQADRLLVQQVGKHKGNLLFPYGFGVVLSNITRKQFRKARLDEILPSHKVICSDEFTEACDMEAFQERLWGIFDLTFDNKLSLPILDRIRWHVFPEIRIEDATRAQPALALSERGESVELETVIPDVMKVMDMQQEKLARSLGSGHRVIHGVAGSGKTMILGYRCLFLAQLLAKPILVVCFNITLATRLKALMQEKDLASKVQVYHFHEWCGEQIRAYNLDRPEQGPDYIRNMVEVVIGGVEKGHIPRGQYGALLIDEGHDFEQEWLKMIVQMVDPDDGSLLLLYDDAQSIYRSKTTMDFTLSSVGIEARGRTSILKVNYRNTDEILDFAYRFAGHYLSPNDCDEDHVPLVEPTGAGRSGPKPHFQLLRSEVEEMHYLLQTMQKLQEQRGHRWGDMLIACQSKKDVARFVTFLQERGVPTDAITQKSEKKALDMTSDTVKVMTIWSSKGLEFPVVLIPDVGRMPRPKFEDRAEARLLYVGMTRSTDKLLMTASRPSEFAALLAA